MQPVSLTARAINNAPKNNTPKPAQPFNSPTLKRKTPKKRVKKVNITYRAPNSRKLTTRSSKPAPNTPIDNDIDKNIAGFSDNDEVENEDTYLCGSGISKDYINTINTAIDCNLKVTMAFMRDMLQR
jgi:hypothetical protein